MNDFSSPVFSTLTIFFGAWSGWMLAKYYFDLHRKINKSDIRNWPVTDSFISSLALLLVVVFIVCYAIFITLRGGSFYPGTPSYEIYRLFNSKIVLDVIIGLIFGILVRMHWNREHNLYPFEGTNRSRPHRIALKLNNSSFESQPSDNRTYVREISGISRTNSHSNYLQYDPEAEERDFLNFISTNVKLNYEFSLFLDRDKNTISPDKISIYEKERADFNYYILSKYNRTLVENKTLIDFGICLIWFRSVTRSTDVASRIFPHFFAINASMGNGLNLSYAKHIPEYISQLENFVENEISVVNTLIQAYIGTHGKNKDPDVSKTIGKLNAHCKITKKLRKETIRELFIWRLDQDNEKYIYNSLIMKRWMVLYGYDSSAKDELISWINNSKSNDEDAPYGAASWNIDKGLFDLLYMYDYDDYFGFQISKLLVERMRGRFSINKNLMSPENWLKDCEKVFLSDSQEEEKYKRLYLLSYLSAEAEFIERFIHISNISHDTKLDIALLKRAEIFVEMGDRCYRNLLALAFTDDIANEVSRSVIQTKFFQIYGSLLVSLLEQGDIYNSSKDEIVSQAKSALHVFEKAMGLLDKSEQLQNKYGLKRP